jgi:hypothetical protein
MCWGLPSDVTLMKINFGHYFENNGQNFKNNGQNSFQSLRYSFAKMLQFICQDAAIHLPRCCINATINATLK